MIIYNREVKKLVVPSSLGNFGNAGGSVGGISSGEAREIAEEVVTDALVNYVDETQLNDTLNGYATTAVTDGIATGISALSGATENIQTNIGTLSGSINDLRTDLDGKQNTLEAGNGIDINNTTVSAKIASKGLEFNGDGEIQLVVGEGLGFSGNTLVVSGISGGESNYLIVNSLSEISNPYEGLEAYVRERTESVVYTGYTIDASQINEGYVAHIYYDGSSENAVYHSGNNFFWNWDNDSDGDLRQFKDYFYTINSEGTVFTVLFNNPAASVTFEEGVITATTSTTIDIFHKAVTYRYNGTAWEVYQAPKVYYLDEMTQEERSSLFTEILRYTETSFPAGNYRFFVTNKDNDEYLGRFELFVARFEGAHTICFSGVMQSRYSNKLLQRGYKIRKSGDLELNFSQNTEIPSPAYNAFMNAKDYGEYSDGGSLTGASQEFWANVWETIKSEGIESFARKTLLISVKEGDTVPTRFNLIYKEGDFNEGESQVKLHFGAIYNSIGDSSLHSMCFRLTKNSESSIYIVDNIVEYSYNNG